MNKINTIGSISKIIIGTYLEFMLLCYASGNYMSKGPNQQQHIPQSLTIPPKREQIVTFLISSRNFIPQTPILPPTTLQETAREQMTICE